MRISSIDIGTNTILLLIADANSNGIVKVIHDEQIIARLGKGVDEHRVINQETFRRVADFLRSYHNTSRNLQSEKIIAVGTSALRDAANKKEFCEFILHNVGINIQILSGDDEAEWTCRGAVIGIDAVPESFTVLDIGGGSTEIISCIRSRITHKVSLDIGSVRITERILRGSPPTSQKIAEARRFIRDHFETLDLFQNGVLFAIGVAGTLTTLAAMQLQLTQYDPKRVHGYELHYDDVLQSFSLLRGKSIDEIKSIPQISAGRSDIIFAGVIILLEFMEAAGLKKITVSDRGLRYGIVLREIQR
ncbi:MAG: Ppx/GppA phosphatase family protein [Bacteroidota bacterium]